VRLKARFPRFVTSTLEAGPARAKPILDGSDHTLPNQWKLPAHTVALVGRPAVWTALDISTPRIPLGFGTIPSFRHRWEQDVGGHLFIAVAGADPARVTIVEGGPFARGGGGALVPFCYPEDDFARRGIVDFDPIVIAPPNGLSEEFFADLVRRTQSEYDGDQRYLAVEISFLRVGRDSNSYAMGVLLACGVDVRAIPKPHGALRFEWIGYPGAEDPVHKANFGAYFGKPSSLGDGIVDVASHNADGSVRLVLVGGQPGGRARLPDGSEVALDALGRIVFSPEDASAHGLPSVHTEPPEQIRSRPRFPANPAPAGAQITLIVDGRPVPLVPGDEYAGQIVERHDAVTIATLQTAASQVVLPVIELGVELRDPKRVDKLLRVGTKLTVGLHRDRRPKLIAHGSAAIGDAFGSRRFHAPSPLPLAAGALLALSAVAGLFYLRFR